MGNDQTVMTIFHAKHRAAKVCLHIGMKYKQKQLKMLYASLNKKSNINGNQFTISAKSVILATMRSQPRQQNILPVELPRAQK